VLALSLLASIAPADELLFRYEGDVLPDDPMGGFTAFQPCDTLCGCNDFVENGRFVVEWGTCGEDVVFDREISHDPDPAPPTLWVEWRFRSNLAVPAGDAGCDGVAIQQYRNIVYAAYLHGDIVYSADLGSALASLPVNEFYTVRFQSFDGENFTYAVDGSVFFNYFDATPALGSSRVKLAGSGSCDRPAPDFVIRDEWDFVRYGTISSGEVILSSDPSSGLVDAQQYPSIDRFTVTFDLPAFAYIDDITVTVTGPGFPATPQILWVKRPDNSEPDTVEIVLDQPIPMNAATTFTFNTGGTPNTVTYIYGTAGACCLGDGSCEASNSVDCPASGGSFQEGAACEEDVDGDNHDALCGDLCPMDSSKLTPGQCGCGAADTDSDQDTVADCLDQCDGFDDTIDVNDNDIPDCTEFTPIPTASTWGLGILALLLLIAGKLRRTEPRGFSPRGLSILALLLLGLSASSAHAARHYVKTTGTGNCSTWTNACSLSTALTNASSGDEIWVKAGTYSPFTLKNGVKIIGGFAGTETAASQSNPATNATIVDGGGTSQCVVGNGDGPSTVLRGFTLRNGYLSGYDSMGAGIYLIESSAKIVNSIIEDNQAEFFGAGAAVKGTGAPEFINCTFRENGTGSGTSAKPYGGGAVWAHSGSAKFTNCLFHDNIAGDGGAFGRQSGTATFVNCTIAYNKAEFGTGGGIVDDEGAVTVQNSIIWANTSARGNAQVSNGSYAASAITYTDVQGGFTGTGNINSDPSFTNPGSDDYSIPNTSPCRNAASNSLLPADVADLDWDTNTTEQVPKELSGSNRKVDLTVDMGAYESPAQIIE
jgi:hypothetical protein